MIKVFIDSDVVLDLFTKRRGFYLPAAGIFTIIDSGKARGFTSPLVFSNVYYLCRKYKNKKFADTTIRKLKNFLSVLEMNEKTVNLAIASDFNDFEDSLQYYTAIENKIDYIITRNINDYKKSKISVISPEDFVKMLLITEI